MKKSRLIQYCEENDIFVPTGVGKDYLESAVVRHFLSKHDAAIEECFGFWENENSHCMLCDHQEKCRSVSVGMDFDKYLELVDKEEYKKIRF